MVGNTLFALTLAIFLAEYCEAKPFSRRGGEAWDHKQTGHLRSSRFSSNVRAVHGPLKAEGKISLKNSGSLRIGSVNADREDVNPFEMIDAARHGQASSKAYSRTHARFGGKSTNFANRFTDSGDDEDGTFSQDSLRSTHSLDSMRSAIAARSEFKANPQPSWITRRHSDRGAKRETFSGALPDPRDPMDY